MMRTAPAALSAALLLGLLTGVAPAQADDPAIEGRVTAASGTGVAGAEVRAVSGSSAVASVTTSADGSYALDVPDGTYRVEVAPNVSRLASASAIWVEAPRTTSLDFILSEPNPGRVRVTASVALETGQPIGGGNLLFSGAGNRIGADGFVSMLQPAGASGTWSLSGNAAIGSQVLTVSASGGPVASLLQDTDLDLTIPVTRTTVAVRGNDGAPLANALVILNAGGWGTPASSVEIVRGLVAFRTSWTASARTDATGTVTLLRPALTAPARGILSVDGPTADLAGSFSEVTIPATDGTFARDLASRTIPAPTPGATPTAIAAPTRAPSPSPAAPSPSVPAATPTWVVATGTIRYSHGVPVPGAVIIATDPAARVNGGNSADANGVFTVAQPAGFTGTWSVATRPQSRLAVRDPLTFSLSGGATRTWTADQRIDFLLPTTVYRIRVVDPSGNPIPNVRVGVSVVDAPGNEGRVAVIAGEPDFRGSWNGWDVTGPDGIAQVPGLASAHAVQAQVAVDPDPGSRLMPQALTRATSALSETVIVLQGRQPTITAVSRTTASPGDTITLTGANLVGVERVLIGSVPQEFTVDSATQLRIRVTSDATTGSLRLESNGTASNGELVTVTSANLRIAQSALAAGTVGTAYRATLTAEGGLAPFRWARVAGSLPTGLSLGADGVVTGTPTRALSSSATLAVTDARGSTVSRVLTWRIDPRPATAPGPVTAVRATAGAGRVSLGWTMPTSDGGNPITGYQVQGSADGRTWVTEIATTRTISLAVSLPAPVGSARWYRVAAVNASGVGAYEARSVTGPVTAYTVPSAPLNLQVTRLSSTQVRVSWDPPASANGAAVTAYRVRSSTDGVGWTTVVPSTTQRSATLSVASGRRAWVQVSAQNLAGLGPWAQGTTS